MYEQPKVTILLFLEDDIVTISGPNNGFKDENVDPDGWVD